MIKKINKKIKKSLSIKKEIAKRFQKSSEKKEKDNQIVDKMKKTKISIIGIGGGGGSIVSEIASILSGASFIAANTDTQALEAINKNVKPFSFGQKLTQGLGTGMNVDLGREAAQNEKDRVEKLCQGQDLCIIVACLGGGTGSGAASVFAKISKSLGNLTYGIFTLPFEFEGEKKMEIAKDALKKIKGNLDAITLIPNERAFKIIDKTTPLRQALSVINKNLAENLEGLIETIYEPGLINIDFADFKTIFKNKGKIAYLNTIETSTKEGSVKDLMSQILNSPLYPYTIKNAKGVLFNISGEKTLSLLEVNQISKSISELVNPEAKIIFGTCIVNSKKKTDSVIKITLLAIGCGEKKVIKKKPQIVKLKTKQKKIKKIKEKVTLVKKNGEIGHSNRVKKSKKEKIKKEKKVKIKIIKKPEKKISTINEVNSEIKIKPIEISDERVRKSGLQIKEEAQGLEKEILEKEKFWETPAFLRRKSTK